MTRGRLSHPLKTHGRSYVLNVSLSRTPCTAKNMDVKQTMYVVTIGFSSVVFQNIFQIKDIILGSNKISDKGLPLFFFVCPIQRRDLAVSRRFLFA